MRCLVVDDHPVVRQGIRALLERELPGTEVICAPTAAEALAKLPSARPDVVVIDPSSAGGQVEQVVTDFQRSVDSPIVIFTGNGGARLLADALKAGVKGYVRKDSPPEDLVRAIQAAYSGDFYVDPALSSTIVLEEGERTLTVRQRQILQMLADGRPRARAVDRDRPHAHQANPGEASRGHADTGGRDRHPQRPNPVNGPQSSTRSPF